MPRLFTSLQIPPDTGFALSLKRGGLQGAHWIDPDNYHITLRFVGDVDNRTANDIAAALERLAGTSSLAVQLDRLDVFGGDRPRALFAGVAPNDGLSALQASHERVLQRLGLPPDGRKFVPHVTLARLRGTHGLDAARFIAEAGQFTPLRFRPTQFILYSSRNAVGGGPYLVEQSYPLAP